MRIASFNLENLGRRFRDDAFFEERIRALRPRIARLSADVLCFQEVDGVRAKGGGERGLDALSALLEDTPAAGFALAGSHHPDTGRTAEQHNLVVASRFPVERVRQLHHDRVPPLAHRWLSDPDAEPAEIRFDRPILHVAIALPDGARLHVVNLHLKAPVAASVPGGKASPEAWRTSAAWAEGFYLASLKRAGQALEARLLVEEILDADPAALVVLAGDFNAEENETPLRIVRAEVEATGNPRLAGRELVPLWSGVPEHARYTVIHRGRRILLDHLLASRALLARFRGMEIHNEGLADETLAFGPGESIPDSFHAPIVATFAD